MHTIEKQSKAGIFQLLFSISVLTTILCSILIPSESFTGQDIFVQILVGLTIALLALWILFTYQERKERKNLRSFKYGFNAAATVFLALVGIFLVNYLVSKHNFRKDFTKHGSQSLSPQTIKLMQGLKEKVSIKTFIDPQNPALSGAMLDYLKQIKIYGKDKLDYEVVDVLRNPHLARAYEITQLDTIVIELGDKGDKRDKIRSIDNTNIEQKMLNGLIGLTRDSKKIVYFLKGHGEHEIANQQREGVGVFKEELEKTGYTVKDLSLLEESKVPADAKILVVAGPKKEPLEPELKAMKEYLSQYGNLFLMADPDSPQKWNELLKEYGVSFSNRIILEPNALAQLAQLSIAHPVIVTYNASTDIGREAKENPTLYYIAADLTIKEERAPGIEVNWLAKSGPRSWAEADLTMTGHKQEVKFDAARDVKGPVTIAAVIAKKSAITPPPAEDKKEAEDKPSGKEGRVVVFGDSDFATNQYFSNLGNSDFALNAVAWLGLDTDLISIRPKPQDQSKLEISEYTARLIKLGSIFAYPFMLLGFSFYLYRRRLAL